jgi:protein gp37
VKGHPYEQGFDLRLVPEKLTEPLTWKKPRRVFVNSMSDLFQDGVPDDYIDQVFAVMSLTPRHTYQVLTKRPERMRSYLAMESPDGDRCDFVAVAANELMSERDGRMSFTFLRRGSWPLPNVWLGVSVENQHFADERIPLLLQTPATVRFISAEPLLGPVDLTGLFAAHFENPADDAVLDWVIVGGESGPHARQFDCEWALSIVRQCQAATVPVFVKQLGARPFWPYSDGTPFVELHLKSRKGGDMAEWPVDLQVREFPEARRAGVA